MHTKTFTILLLNLIFIISCDELVDATIDGCIDTLACNYQKDATIDDGSCILAEENKNCDGNCITNFDCAGICGGNAVLDDCGICSGNFSLEDCDSICPDGQILDCFGICDGVSVLDECNVCGGTGILDECGICDGNNDCELCGDPEANNYFENTSVECDDLDGDNFPDCCIYNDPDAANSLVEEANEQLFDDLTYVFEQDPPDDPEDIDQYFDMTDSYELYLKALELDEDNNGAHFGLAFTEIAMVTQDNKLEEALDEWTECLEDLFEGEIDPFNYNQSETDKSILFRKGYNSGLPLSGHAFYSFDFLQILKYLPIITSPNDEIFKSQNICPEIESLQELVEDLFLDRISKAIIHLNEVVNENFVFKITPEMLDDEYQDPITIDDTEIYLMKAALHQLRAAIYMIITYNVNVPLSDFIETEGWVGTNYDWQWISQNSDFLTIRTGKEESLMNAHSDLNNVINSIEQAWVFLQSDDDIDQDIILLEDVTNLEDDMEDEIDRDIDEVIIEARQLLNDDYLLEYDYVYCNYSEYYEECENKEVEITLNISQFFNDPIQNLKSVMPVYNVSTTICEFTDYDWDDSEYELNITLNDNSISGGDYFSFNGNCQWDDLENDVYVNLYYYSWSGSESLKGQLKYALQSECNKIISDYNYDEINYFYLWFNFNGYGDSNQLSLQLNNYYEIETIVQGEWGCPKILWDASDCEEWKSGWDATFGGLFPNMTTEKLFDELLELNDEDCEEILEFNIEEF